MPRSLVPAVLFGIFTLSGFSGLIYESIWSHYLKLFLGHAAYSQTLVLAIFMGGMALGSTLASRYSMRWRQVLLGYALVEAITGVMALGFHQTFESLTQASFDHVIPYLGSGAVVQAYKWGLAGLMILPQSVLLGMTFPLMSAGFLRLAPRAAGGSIALLYFTNSFGGAVGVLAGGFLLIPAVGLPGTMLSAGLLNFCVALLTWLVVKRAPQVDQQAATTPAAPTGTHLHGPGYRLLLVTALITGLASFCYEIGWIRMLSLVLGSTTHAFELMLSAFIFGLAFGGLWVKRRIERAGDPRIFLAYVQLAMGLLALSTLLIYGQTFNWMSTVIHTFARTDAGYAGFNWASHAIASVVMIPTTFCAGMTLPLITHAALRIGVGERAIGAVYAANTVGGIAGVMVATHLLLPALGARGVILAGAFLDFALGLVLLGVASSAMRRRRVTIAACVGGVAFAWAVLMGEFDPSRVVSGVFRHGEGRLASDHRVISLRDGKTASVSLTRLGDKVMIATNGKIDASVNMGPGPASSDEATQTLAGALPLALHPAAKTSAVIGIGSGMTTQALLSHPQLTTVDTVEIEPRMVEAAREGFAPRNRLTFEDPRSRIHIEDAKTFFSLAGRKYDIIVSEPSNPWVSGVSSLFTHEFYRNVVRYLEPAGLLVQWVQLYEIDIDVVASVVKALSPWFSDYAIYFTDRSNMLIVARRDGPVASPQPHIFSSPPLKAELDRIGVASVDDLRARRIGHKDLLDPLLHGRAVPVNSDYFPFVDLNAPRTRYLKADASELTRLADIALPLQDMLSPRALEPAGWAEMAAQSPSTRRLAQMVVRYVMEGRNAPELVPMRQDLAFAHLGMRDCAPAAPEAWEAAWIDLGRLVSVYLGKDTAMKFWDRLIPQKCLARLSPRGQAWRQLFIAVGTRDAAGMRLHAEALLAMAGPSSPPGETLYAAEALMLAHLALGEPQRARSVYRELPPRLPPGSSPTLEMDWLVALAMASKSIR